MIKPAVRSGRLARSDSVFLWADFLRFIQIISMRAEKFTPHCIPCGLCKTRLDSSDLIAVRHHLYLHLMDLRGCNYCSECEVYFAQRKDLNAHLLWASTTGTCGLRFEHNRACKGHHPPKTGKGRAEDRFNFCNKLRQWEKTQLEAFTTNIVALAKARKEGEERKEEQEKAKAEAGRKSLVHTQSLFEVLKRALEQYGNHMDEIGVEASVKQAALRSIAVTSLIAFYQRQGYTKKQILTAVQARASTNNTG